MKRADRIALTYVVSTTGAAVISFLRGRRGMDLVRDTALHGVVVGTGLNIVGWVVFDVDGVPTLINSGEPPNYNSTGMLSDEAIELMAQVNAQDIYAPMRRGGVKVDEIPENPSIVVQEET